MAEEEDFSQLSLPDLFAHKNWKARKTGYETATKEFNVAQPSDPIVREFTLDNGLWKGALGDANVAAQQEALNAYNAFLDAAGTEGARRTRSVTVGPTVEKGLTGRPAAKTAALEILLLLIELDKADPLIEELLPYMSHKQPNIIAATLSALTSIYHAYGCKTVEPKPVVKLLPKAFGHADKNVRAEAQNLTVELYRWLREAMKPLFWGELKEVQQKDLDKLFEPVKAEPAAKPERLLRSQQAAREEAMATAAVDDGEDAGEDEVADGIDLEPEFEAVDVFKKIPKDFSERLASAKWKDRKDALDELYAAVNVPAIQEGQFDDIMRDCAKSMKDANVTVVTVAANCVECMANGLRKGFSRYRATILAPMLDRFKEKKPAVTDALSAACDAVFGATNLGDIQMETMEALKNKNPQIKEQSAKFLVRCLKSTREAPSLEQTKEIAEGSKKLLTESSAPLRDAGAEVLGVLWKIMGDRNMLTHLESLDDIRKSKIKEFSDSAEVKAKWKPKAAAAPPKAAAPTAGAKKTAPASKRPAPGTGKKPPPPPAASPPPVDDAPLQPRPSSRPASKPPAGGLRPPGGGLKPPGAGLQKPTAGLRAPAAGPNAGSPKRQGMILDEAPPVTPRQTIAAPGRGLAGRPLGKPTAPPASPPPSQPAPESAPSALSSIERQELSELRREVDLVRQQAYDLRNDKMRLTSQITELQVQNAQLIEDHTRDVLQIKAKETQLVRARSDAEAAEERAHSMSKEVERLKREISRLGRAQSPVDSSNGMANGGLTDDRSPAYRSPSHPRGGVGYHVANARSYGNIDSFTTGAAVEGKENMPDADPTVTKLSSGLSRGTAPPPPAAPQSHLARTLSAGGSSGRATPNSAAGGDLSDSTGSQPGLGQSGGNGGVESWRRAAEVTQNLKARIEMMKARQNVSRG